MESVTNLFYETITCTHVRTHVYVYVHVGPKTLDLKCDRHRVVPCVCGSL